MAREASSRAWRHVSLVGLGMTSVMLMGFDGAVSTWPGTANTQQRFRTVPNRNATVTVSGYADSTAYQICSHQQTRDPNVWATIGCVYPTTAGTRVDACGVTWYPYTMSVALLTDQKYWFGKHHPAKGVNEFTRVSVNANFGGGGLVTFTGDAASGPMDASACWRSQARENGAKSAITFYRGNMPPERECTAGANSIDGCPFTCNLALGCDSSYGGTQNEFYNSSYRVNADGQTTALTRFDAYGPNSAYGVPGGDWFYEYDGATGYYLMRRWVWSADSLNIRRGENRRNSRVQAWMKQDWVNQYNQQVGLVSRFYNADNYFVFLLWEHGGDGARIHVYNNGNYVPLATTYPSLNLLTWNRIAFDVQDRGTWQASGFLPNGNCRLAGLVNGTEVVSVSNTACLHAPFGRYGIFTWLNQSSGFWDLDASPLDPLGPALGGGGIGGDPPPIGP